MFHDMLILLLDVLIPLCMLLEIKLTKLWLCILLNHIDQDHSVQDQDQLFWSQTGLVLRPTVLYHVTVVGYKTKSVRIVYQNLSC